MLSQLKHSSLAWHPSTNHSHFCLKSPMILQQALVSDIDHLFSLSWFGKASLMSSNTVPLRADNVPKLNATSIAFSSDVIISKQQAGFGFFLVSSYRKWFILATAPLFDRQQEWAVSLTCSCCNWFYSATKPSPTVLLPLQPCTSYKHFLTFLARFLSIYESYSNNHYRFLDWRLISGPPHC